jgi:hypothetical protein
VCAVLWVAASVRHVSQIAPNPRPAAPRCSCASTGA